MDLIPFEKTSHVLWMARHESRIIGKGKGKRGKAEEKVEGVIGEYRSQRTYTRWRQFLRNNGPL